MIIACYHTLRRKNILRIKNKIATQNFKLSILDVFKYFFELLWVGLALGGGAREQLLNIVALDRFYLPRFGIDRHHNRPFDALARQF